MLCVAVSKRYRLVRAVSLLVALTVGLLMSTFGASSARAEIGSCRSDPVVLLSNGVTLDLSAAIADTDSDVQQVSYALTIPAGTTVTSVTNTSGPLGPKETFQASSTNPANTYTTVTVVYTGARQISVTAVTQVVAITQLGYGSDTGLDNQRLTVSVAAQQSNSSGRETR